MALVPKNKKWLGYTLYVFVVALLLLYYLFPGHQVEQYIDSSVSRINPAYGFKADKIGPWIPAGMRIIQGRVYLDDTSVQPVFKADILHVKPRLMKLINGEYSLGLSGSAYRGDIKGSFQAKDPREAFNSKVSFKDFDLADYAYLAEKLNHKVTGKFSGDIAYSRGPANAEGEGKAELRLNDGQLQFQNPIFGISGVDLQNIELDMELRNREITIVKAELAGPEVKASMTGSIQLQPQIKNSQLNLKGTLEPLAEFYKNYPEIREMLKSMKKRVKRGQYFFAITGTLGDPRFRLL